MKKQTALAKAKQNVAKLEAELVRTRVRADAFEDFIQAIKNELKDEIEAIVTDEVSVALDDLRIER